MIGEIVYLGPRYFARHYFGWRYFVRLVPASSQISVLPKDRIATVEAVATSAAGSAGIRIVQVPVPLRIVATLPINRMVAAEEPGRNATSGVVE